LNVTSKLTAPKTKGSQVWYDRVDGMLTSIITNFFPDGIAFEKMCEAHLNTCSIDMFSFKAYLTRWMAAATKQAPFIFDRVKANLESSAKAAALQCSGSPAENPNGRMCGLSWSAGAAWDGTSGVGQQMAAMEVIQSNLIQQAKAPLTSNTGGTSKGDANAGSGDMGTSTPGAIKPITTADRAGAGILTILIAAIVVSGLFWVSIPQKGV
jgi:mannan endo-1,6-alpha-mannosidase